MKVQAPLTNMPCGNNYISNGEKVCPLVPKIAIDSYCMPVLFSLFSSPLRRQGKHIFLVLAFLLPCIFIFSQESFRRHFIIAYDVSTPFINSEKNCPAYAQALINLFENLAVYNYNEAYQENLQVEKNNGLPFFDKQRDEISFFHFNIAEPEFDRLRVVAAYNDENTLVTEFDKIFLKNKFFCWSAYTGKGGPGRYIRELLSIPPAVESFQRGVSMSNFVYPLVLNKIDTSKFAEEYVLILLSDFLAGSMFGNTEDLNRVRDIFHVVYGVSIPPHSPVGYIKKQIDFLASQYYKIDFFQYAFQPLNGAKRIGIISYKIKPKVGVLTPENIALFVDGNLHLNQRGYKSKEFRVSATSIKFTHNISLKPQELKLIISMPVGKKDSVLFNDVIASKNATGGWQSAFTDDSRLMNFDTQHSTYFIPDFTVGLDTLVNKRDFEKLNFQYIFKTKYSIAGAQPLNFIYKTERALPIENIDYSTKVTIIIMYYVLPAMAAALLSVFLAAYGKPKSLHLRLDGFLDSFEKIDFKTYGKLITPFKAWNSEKHNLEYLLVKGTLGYQSAGSPFNWRSPIHLRLQWANVPEGFELFLKQFADDNREYSSENTMMVKQNRDHTFSFVVGIRQNNILKQVTDPELVKFSVEAAVKDSFFLANASLNQILNYKFHLGADMHDVWVAFDPGTSGSCVAVGSATGDIVLGEDRASNRIIPSVLVFDKSENFQQRIGNNIPEQIYRHGATAQVLYGSNPKKYVGFQSIKKLLGFKDVKKILFDNKNELELKGKDLASLLVKGLYRDVNAYFIRPDFNADDYKRDNKFNPFRAVVAIPNNFTISKIKEMVECIDDLKQFKEIRYVYEAEAVLFYYLSNFSQLSQEKEATDKETILVYDMGGATINATVVSINKTSINGRFRHEIDILAKIGYGIGGDTIDYCISSFILSCSEEYPELKAIDISVKKVQLAKLAFEIKKEMIANYYQSSNKYLITAFNLETWINSALSLSIHIDEETSKMYSYFKKEGVKFTLFSHSIFTKFIYNNVRDAVTEVVELASGIGIDKIIFSGRSTSFPLIKETVKDIFKARGDKTKSISLKLEESKIAVAKGACWYGVNKNSVVLNNLKTNASFGFKKKLSAGSPVEFTELVSMGRAFNTHDEDIDSFQGTVNIAHDFASDGTTVQFFQVMGEDADKILAEEQKHKFSRIASIGIDQVTEKIGMKVNADDRVECVVILQSGRKITEIGAVADQEIGEANDEHYTWIV